MRFTKMQGAGNDFIIIDNREQTIPEDKLPELAKRLCTRRLSIGADGLMVMERAQGAADFRMGFYNSDGSVGEMCGNGARCISRYGYEHGLSQGDTVTVETTAGVVTGTRVTERMYTVRLNDPTKINLHHPVAASGQTWDCDYVELGNPAIPHAVVVEKNWQSIPEPELREICRTIRFCPDFPKGANVTFCRLMGEDHLVARTFERGVEDFTLACGTGCGATVTALTLRGLVSGKNVRVSMPGGDL